MSKKKDPNVTVGYGYVGRWHDGTLGWFLPTHLLGYNIRLPEPPDSQGFAKGELFELCKITVEKVPGKRKRRCQQ